MTIQKTTPTLSADPTANPGRCSPLCGPRGSWCVAVAMVLLLALGCGGGDGPPDDANGQADRDANGAADRNASGGANGGSAGIGDPDANGGGGNDGGRAEPRLRVAREVELAMPDNHGGISSYLFHPDGEHLFGGSGIVTWTMGEEEKVLGGEVLLWDLTDGSIAKTLGSQGASIDWLGATADGSRVVSLTAGTGRAKVWDVKAGTELADLELGEAVWRGNGFRARAAMSADGRYLAWIGVHLQGEGDDTLPLAGTLSVLDLETGEKVWTSEAPTVLSVAISPDGSTVAGHATEIVDFQRRGNGYSWDYADATLVCWDLATGEATPTKAVDPDIGNVHYMAFRPDGSIMIVESNIRILEPDGSPRGEPIDWPEDRWAMSGLALSADGKRLARSWSNWIEWLDLESGQVVGLALQGEDYEGMLFGETYGPDLTHVAAGGSSARVLVLEPR